MLLVLSVAKLTHMMKSKKDPKSANISFSLKILGFATVVSGFTIFVVFHFSAFMFLKCSLFLVSQNFSGTFSLLYWKSCWKTLKETFKYYQSRYNLEKNIFTEVSRQNIFSIYK